MNRTAQMQAYLDYWGVAEPPFSTPLPMSRLFFTPRWQGLLHRVQLFTQQRAKFVVITSPPGHCKSTLAKWVYHTLPTGHHDVAMISLFQEEADGGWLLPKLAKHLSIDEANPQHRLERIVDQIDGLNQSGKVFTVIVDEAHKIVHPDALSEIHSLLGMQTLVETGISFVLCGNPYLQQLLKLSEEIRSRTSLSVHFELLRREDILPYINHRTSLFGMDSSVFEKRALEPIYINSYGIFSRLNALLENCLIEAFLNNQNTIDSSTVVNAALYLPEINAGNVKPARLVKAKHETTSQASSEPSSKKRIRSGSQGDGKSGNSVEISSLFYNADDK